MTSRHYKVTVGPSTTDGQIIKTGVSVGPQGPPGPEGPIRKFVEIRIFSDSESVGVLTTAGGDFRLPFGGTIKNVGAYVDTAGTTGVNVIDILLNGNTIMATNKINIDSGFKNSEDSIIQPIITTNLYNRLDIMTFDITQITTTAPIGLVVWLDILT